MLQTSNIVFQTVDLTDGLKIGLEYDLHGGALNIFVKNTGDQMDLPCQINILSNRPEQYEESSIDENDSFDYQTDIDDEHDKTLDVISRDDDEPLICVEITNIFVYDIIDDNETELNETIVASSSSSSCTASLLCFDDHTTDNDDGYSTHSSNDMEHSQRQQLSLSLSPCKTLMPISFDDHSHADELLSIRRLIERLIWLSPFKKTVRQMMFDSYLFN